MVEYTFLKYLLRRFGLKKVTAHDKSDLRRPEIYEGDSAESIIKQLETLKDGPETWKFSIEISPSR
jgi:hypothetical protein